MAGSATRVSIVSAGLAGGTGAVWLLLHGEPGAALAMLAAALAGGGLTAALAVLIAARFPPPPGEVGRAGRDRPGVANRLTLLRFVLIAPLVVLLAGGHRGAALVTYALLAATDVLDGVVARRRGETSEFGAVMDPLADVLSTFAVFTVFVVDNFVPLWLYLLLAGRYAMLLVGSLVLFLAHGPIEFRATPAGKIVGVLQAAGAAVIMISPSPGGDGGAREALFALLGLGFASIVASQAVLGWRIIRRRRAQKG